MQMSSLQYFHEFLPSLIITIRQVCLIIIICRFSKIFLIFRLYAHFDLHLLCLQFVSMRL